MALDSVNNRVFIPGPGNIRILIYQLNEKGSHIRPNADHVIGQSSLIARRKLSETTAKDVGAGGVLAFDNRFQRLFVLDNTFGGTPGSRILVFDMAPDKVQDYPKAIRVIGQADFETRSTGGGKQKFGSGSLAIDEQNQRLFVQDSGKARVLVFDIHPERLNNFPEAIAVIGQPDFDSYQPGMGANKMSIGGAPFTGAGMTLDPVNQRLFISDPQNNRILVFDVHHSRLKNFPEAIAVLGQADFNTTKPHRPGAQATFQARDLTFKGDQRIGMRAVSPGGLGYDWVNHRLFVTQLWENRILVFDVAPERLQNYPEAIAVLGQPDFVTFEPRVSQSRFAFPKEPVVDSEKQRLYVSEGFPGGNRVLVFNIEPEHLRNGTKALDVIGHIDKDGQPDFDRRMANDRMDGGTLSFAGAVAVDSVDHRLWVADQYNHRVLGFQLDRFNRPLERDARWVFGQADIYSSELARARNRTTMPVAVGYDEVDKRLYVAEGWNDRVLIFDVDPERLQPGGNHQAAIVLGQDDFNSQEPIASNNRFDFAPGPGTGLLTSGFAFDHPNHRVFISDGKNNRVLVFDKHPDRLSNGAKATGILGQSDFDTNIPKLSDDGMNFPGHLAYDPDHQRLFVLDSRNQRALVFNVALEHFKNGMPANIVIGQPDFTSKLSRQQRQQQATSISNTFNTVPGDGQITAKEISSALGIAYDISKQQLYITDSNHDRIMVFDAAPQRLKNYPSAIAVLGQTSTSSHAPQSVGKYSAQDQMETPKGIAFDNLHRKLFAVDSYWARVLMFSFPESTHQIMLPANSLQTYSSLDPDVALAEWQPKEGLGRIQSGKNTNAAFMFSTTHLQLDPVTNQQSRVLVSQAAAISPPYDREALAYIEKQDDGKTVLFIANQQDHAMSANLVLSGKSHSNRRVSLKAGMHQQIVVEELFGKIPEATTLHISADAPMAVAVWSEIKNRHNEKILNMSPIVRSADEIPSPLIPNLIAGGGFKSEIILLNARTEEMHGALILFNEDGKKVSDYKYKLDPKESFRQTIVIDSQISGNYYVQIQNEDSPIPASVGLVRLADEGLISSTSVSSNSLLQSATIPINTAPNIIRHGRQTQVGVTIANSNTQGVSIRMVLMDTDGNEVARHEQLLPAGMQRTFSPSDLMEQVHFIGTLRLSTDLPVAISARQATTNLRGEEILLELPIMNGTKTGSVIPFIDGDGISTQILFTSELETPLETSLDFFDQNGKELEVTLR